MIYNLFMRRASQTENIESIAAPTEEPSLAPMPPILPVNPALYAFLRKTHTILAYLLFLTFLAHLGAVLFHTLIIRDGLLNRMALWPIRSRTGNDKT